MTKVTRSVITAASLLGILLVSLSAWSAPVKDVRVVNTAAEPVPVTGAVTAIVPSPLPISGTVTAIVPPPSREQMEFVVGDATFADGEMVLYTVPAGHKFVLTDAHFSHNVVNSTQVHGANVRRGLSAGGASQLLFRAFVEANKNVIMNFTTGYEFAAGQEVRYQTGGSAIDGVHLSISGYLTPQ